jgi:hypothetical protein
LRQVKFAANVVSAVHPLSKSVYLDGTSSSPRAQYLDELRTLMERGDVDSRQRRHAEAIDAWQLARAKIFGQIAPGGEAGLVSSGAPLPVTHDIELQIADASLRMIEGLHATAGTAVATVAPAIVTVSPVLARVARIGFRAADPAPGARLAAAAAAATAPREVFRLARLRPLDGGPFEPPEPPEPPEPIPPRPPPPPPPAPPEPIPPPPPPPAPPATWSVDLQVGGEVATLTWQNRARPPAQALLDQVYARRMRATTPEGLTWRATHVVEAAAFLLHVFAYALPRRLADAHRELGDHVRAEQYYLLAARYSFLNRALEAPGVWAALAQSYVAWGDTLYKAEDLDGARQIYGRVLAANATAPTDSALYNTASLADPAADARRVIAALAANADVSSINPAIVLPLSLAAARWQYLGAGLDFYGTTFTPIFMFAYLQDAARAFATRAIQAERDYITFQSQAENETATRRDLVGAISLSASERAGRAELAAAATDERRAMEAAAALARLRADDARRDRENYRQAGYWQYVTQSIAAAHSAGEDWHSSEIRRLASDIEHGKWEGASGKLAAAATLLGGQKSYEYQLAHMQQTIGEMEASIPIAKAQANAASHRERAAQLSLVAADQRLALTQDALAAFDAEVFTPEMWSRMAMIMREISQSYLEWAIRVAKLMERAYFFETDRDVRIIKTEYAPSTTGGLLGADHLLRDIDAFTFEDIVVSQTKESNVKDVLSLANERPFAFQDFLRTGRMTFETRLDDFDHRHPGLYAQRIRAVELEVVGLLPAEGVSGTLRAGGVSRYRTRAGGSKDRIHTVDTFAISEYSPRGDAFVYRSDARKAGLFEGLGVATTWQIDLPRRANNLDYRLITDAVLRRPPLPGEMIHTRSLVLRYDFPEAWYALVDGGATTFEVAPAWLPRNETGFRTDKVAVQLQTDGVSAAGVGVTVTLPGKNPVTLATDDRGAIETAAGNPLAGAMGGPLLGPWTLRLAPAAGRPFTLAKLEQVVIVVQYQFAWPE